MSAMGKGPVHIWPWTLALAMLATASPAPTDAAELRSDNPLNPPAMIYWCPNRTPDQQYSTTQAPGCVPFVSEADKQRAAEREKEGTLEAGPPIKIQSIQAEVSKFLRRYRQFLDCCANDPASVDEVDRLQDQAYQLLKAIQDTGLLNMGAGTNQRQFTTSELIRPVLQARRDLHTLRRRLEQLGESKDTLDALEFEEAGRERRKIQQEEDALTKEFRPVRPPDSARTGVEVEDTTVPNRFGTSIQDTTLPNSFGADIGDVASPRSNQQLDLRPRRGPDIQDTTLPNSRVGPDTQDTTLPNSFGFDVGGKENAGGSSTTPSRVGPAVGDSSLNERR